MKKIDLAFFIDDDSIHVFGAKRAISLANFCNQVLVFNNGKDAFDRISQIFALGKGIPELILRVALNQYPNHYPQMKGEGNLLVVQF